MKLKNPAFCEEYVLRLPAVKGLEKIRFRKPVTFLAGENGAGKSTLLEGAAVAFGFNAEGGSRNFSFSTRETQSGLGRALMLIKGPCRPRDGFFLRAESYYNVASNLDELDEQPAAAPLLRESYGGKSLHAQSHGESFLALALNRFGGRGLYLLDEPEAALSPARQLTLLARMAELVRRDSQFVVATHSPILMAFPEADIYVLTENGPVLTPYEETEHYKITKRFLENPKRMLDVLLGGGESGGE